MFSMPGGWEWILIILIALIIFGPSQLPQLMKTLGRSLNEFKRAASGVQDELEQAAREADMKKAAAAAPPTPPPTARAQDAGSGAAAAAEPKGAPAGIDGGAVAAADESEASAENDPGATSGPDKGASA